MCRNGPLDLSTCNDTMSQPSEVRLNRVTVSLNVAFVTQIRLEGGAMKRCWQVPPVIADVIVSWAPCHRHCLCRWLSLVPVVVGLTASVCHVLIWMVSSGLLRAKVSKLKDTETIWRWCRVFLSETQSFKGYLGPLLLTLWICPITRILSPSHYQRLASVYGLAL
jgi:hypothetical protein